ncbi:hypothetical protein FAM09_11675 [Niastella caeni]|uniref:Outer membrane protein beta-barrel domain-containing protein n=1 Tax=Niastella caeni TaxID=2569763 RepID=A0A4S8HU65_9BACT|nr:outer membrane beta-barrel protein [Niastella caeni]THU39168.1 hypothetical protein FAM09_11675 [Niastella caeni]
MTHPVWPTTKTMLLAVLCFFFCLPVFAQKPGQPGNTIKGKIADTAEHINLHYSIVALINLADSTLYQSVRTNRGGNFELTSIPPGRYTLMVSYPKMADHLQEITITDTSHIDLQTIHMVNKADLLQEVIVRAGLPIRMRGDTLEYTADSFAVKPGANVEELFKRLPGFQVEKNGKIIAQGQVVEKLLVDGDEFFSDDPALAARYLQADAVDKVQLYDDKSEKSKFTGIDDGTRTKTVNLKLKKNRKNGYFGKLSAGSDGQNYYHHEAMGALFDGTRKMSVFGLSSKTGKQDLSYNEMSKYVTQDYEIIDDGTGGIMIRSNSDWEGENYRGNGLPSVQSGGAHYSEKWNYDKQKLVGNYRVKQINATGWQNNNYLSVLPDGTSFSNASESQEKTYSFMQKASSSFTFKLDTFTVIKVSANGNFGNTSESRASFSGSTNQKGIQVNNSEHTSQNDFSNKRFGSNIQYQRKFRKEGRTLSLAVQQEYNNKSGDAYNYSANNYFDPTSGVYRNADTLNQVQKSINSQETYAAKMSYTEQLGKSWRLAVEYGWKNNVSGNTFNTLNNVNDKFTERVDTLSNDYTFNATTHITGGSLVYIMKKATATLGGNVFFTGFTQTNNDLHDQHTRRFTNFAPQATFNFKPKQGLTLNFSYKGETVQPTVEQLQPLRRSSNRLHSQIGNPDLQPGFRHSGHLYFYKANWVQGKSLNANVNFNYTANSVASRIFTDAQNRTTSQYINLNSIPYIYSNINYSWQYKKYNLKPAINFSASKNGYYTIQNDQKIKNESANLNATFSLTHDWKNVMNTSYKGTISNIFGWSDIPGRANTQSISHNHEVDATIYLPWHMEVTSDCSFNFQPKNASFNSRINNIQWNAFIQKKFLKNDQALVKFSVNDLLNNNNGYRRYVYGSNVSESNRLVIKRYWLLTMTWNFSKSIK